MGNIVVLFHESEANLFFRNLYARSVIQFLARSHAFILGSL